MFNPHFHAAKVYDDDSRQIFMRYGFDILQHPGDNSSEQPPKAPSLPQESAIDALIPPTRKYIQKIQDSVLERYGRSVLSEKQLNADSPRNMWKMVAETESMEVNMRR